MPGPGRRGLWARRVAGLACSVDLFEGDPHRGYRATAAVSGTFAAVSKAFPKSRKMTTVGVMCRSLGHCAGRKDSFVENMFVGHFADRRTLR